MDGEPIGGGPLGVQSSRCTNYEVVIWKGGPVSMVVSGLACSGASDTSTEMTARCQGYSRYQPPTTGPLGR